MTDLEKEAQALKGSADKLHGSAGKLKSASQALAGAAQPDAPTEAASETWDKLSVVVLAGDHAVFSIDEAGNVQVPATFAMRSEVGVALARASAVLAAQPEPNSSQQILNMVFRQLGQIDTDASREAFAKLEAAVNGQTEALAAATVALDMVTADIGASIPTAPGTH
ncbi:hypothetical protein MKL09_08840 [Methylobacterium sp. J-048]|uniref:hypothetical protein n=1 Tax=Methylobacterium sp. J-048 TaxID=2836635 RepID=UPI001FB8B845|nr:hypothetical protein [Methylobacterium sp. J-048]MCJ2056660.1 hypothetical protein [Methylobacterium sp. J-048]